tara:strand:- start:365 stop:877 length:513 start_codon:yes stop_codon:yes gene_type:complete
MPQGAGTYGNKQGRPKMTPAQRKAAAKKRRDAMAAKRKATVGKIKSKVKKVVGKVKSRIKGATAKYQGTTVNRATVRGVTKTKGGNYPKYKKGSAKGKSFNSALSSARKKGQKTFTWDKRSYHTGVKKTTRKGASYTSVVGKGSRLKNMSSKMKANAAARRKKRAAKKKK